MTESIYSKYILKNPEVKITKRIMPSVIESFSFEGRNADEPIEFSIALICVDLPHIMEEKPMVHEFDQILGFLGADTQNMENFEAEVELSLGREREIQRITEPTVVYVPKGLAHCPINFKRIDKPIIFLDISFTSDYKKGGYYIE
ncbi:MAG: hypothetical protein ACFFDI_28610 [Promethearchaeota archaeon]